jgi:hypothetical protein
MRQVLTVLAAAALWCGLVSIGAAEEKKAGKLPEGKKVASPARAAGQAELQAEMYRTRVALFEAQAAEKPDQAKIDQLVKELQRLRAECRASGVQPCPWGGPGMGWGRGAGWGGPGKGAAAGRGPGFGPGGGRGWGGGGRGFGPGGGMGLAPGGPAFVDEDKDGICDHFELRHGMHPH